eukprot:TRINITY_DN15540_c2_g1_i1.p1 TRINITY_DN15540_c2_g1~~TRINITY_DN15540_c2_g1_i1.p1  ORF type:complete len:342 (+),score=76.55 TRINITY_DN15540_c2_g1_i1:79-1104(+)
MAAGRPSWAPSACVVRSSPSTPSPRKRCQNGMTPSLHAIPGETPDPVTPLTRSRPRPSSVGSIASRKANIQVQFRRPQSTTPQRTQQQKLHTKAWGAPSTPPNKKSPARTSNTGSSPRSVNRRLSLVVPAVAPPGRSSPGKSFGGDQLQLQRRPASASNFAPPQRRPASASTSGAAVSAASPSVGSSCRARQRWPPSDEQNALLTQGVAAHDPLSRHIDVSGAEEAAAAEFQAQSDDRSQQNWSQAAAAQSSLEEENRHLRALAQRLQQELHTIEERGRQYRCAAEQLEASEAHLLEFERDFDGDEINSSCSGVADEDFDDDYVAAQQELSAWLKMASAAA